MYPTHLMLYQVARLEQEQRLRDAEHRRRAAEAMEPACRRWPVRRARQFARYRFRLVLRRLRAA
jgi:hypothetical protein